MLSALLETVKSGYQTIALLDSRMPLPANMPENLTVKFIEPSIWQRFRAEWWLMQNVRTQDTLFCFGNLPPLLKVRGHVIVFVQNRYLIDDVKLDGFSPKIRLRLKMNRFWLSGRMTNADEFVVQSPSMKALLQARTKQRVPIRVLPFMEHHDGYVRRVNPSKVPKEKDFDFLYVASGEPHKNHRRLIEAWCLLAAEGRFPSLALTVDETSSAELCEWVQKKKTQYDLKLNNLGILPHDQIKLLYERVCALVYPSTLESFGLPLIEARQAGLPVLASELDYVRDALDPEQTFDPESAISIARAVKRFMGAEEKLLPLLDATQFMASVLERPE